MAEPIRLPVRLLATIAKVDYTGSGVGPYLFYDDNDKLVDMDAIAAALNATAPTQAPAVDAAALDALYRDARYAARQAILAARPPACLSTEDLQLLHEYERDEAHRTALLAVYDAGRRGMRTDG